MFICHICNLYKNVLVKSINQFYSEGGDFTRNSLKKLQKNIFLIKVDFVAKKM